MICDTCGCSFADCGDMSEVFLNAHQRFRWYAVGPATRDVIEHMLKVQPLEGIQADLAPLSQEDQRGYIDDFLTGELFPSEDDSSLSDFERFILKQTRNRISLEEVRRYILHLELHHLEELP